MKKGDTIKFEFTDKVTAYGTILWTEGNTANIDIKNPITLQHEVIKKPLTEIIKIGNH